MNVCNIWSEDIHGHNAPRSLPHQTILAFRNQRGDGCGLHARNLRSCDCSRTAKGYSACRRDARKGQLTVSSEPSKPIGDVLPIYVSIANGTDSPRAIVPVRSLPSTTPAARIARCRRLKPRARPEAPANYAPDYSAPEPVVQSAGALVPASAQSPDRLFIVVEAGAAIGGAIGTGTGAFHGATAGPAKANEQARTQLTALALRAEDVRQDFTVSGYVFFPKGDYKRIQMLLVDDETGNTEVISQPIM